MIHNWEDTWNLNLFSYIPLLKVIMILSTYILMVFPLGGGSDGKASTYNVGVLGWIPGSGSSLEKEMATCSVLLPRKSHGRRGLMSMGSQRVGHDRATSLFCGLRWMCILHWGIHFKRWLTLQHFVLSITESHDTEGPYHLSGMTWISLYYAADQRITGLHLQ